MKVTIKGHMIGYHFDHSSEGETFWTFSTYSDGKKSQDCIASIPYEFEAEVPDNINVNAALVKNLEAEKKKALDAYNETVREINERLSKLQAIEYAA